MKTKAARKNDIAKRNVNLEVYKRLSRSSHVSFALMSHVKQLKPEGEILYLCLGEIFSYLHDDIAFVLRETKKDGYYDWFLKNHKIQE
ncbi:TPA: hypothetical protein G8O67_002018 [Salmonella enterica]|uniref:Uncharacterized protein n=1 Tax=Salmonella enterica TaxID=28901 RepID=A0A756I933_SALER|nr:hypothetical protein [Salmonella enterica]